MLFPRWTALLLVLAAIAVVLSCSATRPPRRALHRALRMRETSTVPSTNQIAVTAKTVV